MSRVARVNLRGVGRTYGGTVAVRGITLQLDAGGVYSLEGANGAGKTTLLGMIGTLVKPSAGDIAYGSEFRSLRQVREQIGWLSHEALVYPDLTPRQSLRFAARCYGRDVKEAWERGSLRFGLSAFAERPFRLLSRGQRQRLALARATFHEPSLLLLDEPTTGLDRASVAALRGVIEEETARGAVIVLVTHDVGFAAAVATVRLHMERGQLVEPPAG